jgi:hypothetical protein
MNKKVIISSIVILTYLSVIFISVHGITMQVSTQKIFTLPKNPSPFMDGRTYTTGEEVSYDIQGYPSTQIIIHRWNEISVLQQGLIVSRLTSEGYTEGQEVPE